MRRHRKLMIFLTGLSSILLAGVMTGSELADVNAQQINSYFKCETFIVEEDPFADLVDSQYYVPKFTRLATEAEKQEMKKNGQTVTEFVADKEKLYAYDKQVARTAVAEGAVVLWNNDNTLPLTNKSETINMFTAKYYYTINGSGGTRMSEYPTMKGAFEEAGYKVNEALWTTASAQAYHGGPSAINEGPWNDSYYGMVNSGVGIYMLCRKGSEGCDLSMQGSDSIDGNLTNLSQNEIDHIENLIKMKEQGKLGKIVLLLNTVSGSIQFDTLSKYMDKIDACMWIGLGGTSGPAGAVDAMSGKVSPSGRIVDTFVYNSFSAPSTENAGNFDYSNQEAFADNLVYKKLKKNQGGTDSTEKNFKYQVYQEGIYVGYKYYETRYEDTVMNQGNASSSAGVKTGHSAWDYAQQVIYPFGYGLGYTTFSQTNMQVKQQGDAYVVSVDVTNTGKVASKEVVQVYLQKPYTAYSKENHIEQASVNLVGFAKTETLAAGATEKVTITIPKTEFWTYDAYGAKTYITEGGDYYLSVGDNAHDALNNILAAKGYTGDKAGDANMVKRYTLEQDLSTALSQYTGNEIVNQFDDVDIKLTSYGAGEVTYLSRSNWENTYPAAVSLALTEELLTALDYGKSWEEDPELSVPTYEKQSGMTLFSMWKDTEGNELPYDHPLWDLVLDQTTFMEQAYLLCNAWCATQALPSIAAPGTENRDGPAGLNYLPDIPVIGLGMGYPCENLLASTWDTKLVWKIGECLGEDNLACGFTFLYAPGANTHRNAFGGRNGEYFSEDGLLAGLLCEAEVKGMQSNGSGAQAKHFALNDMEINRNGGCMWVNEQSIREIYLKAFEYASAVGRGEMLSVMSTFTRIGALWGGAHHGMMTDVLRGEWGFIGFVQSDGNAYPLMSNYVDGLRAGNDIFMCGGGKNALNAYMDSPVITNAMRESTKRVLYALTKTHAMNGLTASTRIVRLTPWWRTALDGVIIGVAVITAFNALLTVISIFSRKDSKKQKIKNKGKENDYEK